MWKQNIIVVIETLLISVLEEMKGWLSSNILDVH